MVKSKRITVLIVIVLLVSSMTTCFGGRDKNGNGFPSGPHYELGLIGRPTDYTGGGTDNSNRHNIFIPLDTSGYVDGKIKIYMTQGSDFEVVDGDATDGEADLQIGPGYYAIFARALGKPTKSNEPNRVISIDAYFTYWVDNGMLSDAIWMGNVELERSKRRPVTKEISRLFYFTGDLTYMEDGNEVEYHFTNEWVFDIPYLEDYWWDLANQGVKRLEIRFYPVPEGYVPPRDDELLPPEL